MIEPEPPAVIHFDTPFGDPTFGRIPAAGWVGVIEERCENTHSTTTLHFGLPCPTCGASL